MRSSRQRGVPSQGGRFPLPHAPHSISGRFRRSWGPTWVRGEPITVESVGARLSVGLGGQGAESIDPDGRRKTRKRARAAAGRGASCWRRRRSESQAAAPRRPLPPRPPPLPVVPAAGNSGAATRLKAATCCICAATAATGPRPGPCAAASRAAWCCRIFKREEGRMWRAQRRAAALAPTLARHPARLPARARRGPGTYRRGVGSAGPERQRRRVEGAQLARHLLHPPQRALPVCVRQLDHEAGRRTLDWAGDAAVSGPGPSPGPGQSALPIRPFPGAPIAFGEEEPVPTPTGFTLGPRRPPSPPWSGCRADSGWPPELPPDSQTSQRHSLGQDRGIGWLRPQGPKGHEAQNETGSPGNPGSAHVTFTGAIRAPQDGALLDMAEGLEQASDVLLTLLLPQHPHKQLSVLWG